MKKITRLDEYQKAAMSTIYPFKDKGRQLEYAVLALCGESGELANVVKKIVHYKDPLVDGKDVLNELSDVLWYVACVADALNLKLSEVATFNIRKVFAKLGTKARAGTEARMKGGGELYDR